MSGERARQSVNRARLMFNLGLFLHYAAWGLSGWMVVVAVALIVVKVAGALTWIQPWQVFVTGAPIAIGAMATAFKRKYSSEEVAAWLDLKGRGGGEVIAGTGTVDVRPVLRTLPLLKRNLLPLALLVASLLVPWVPQAQLVSAAAIENKARVVDERIERAKEIDVLDEQETIELRQDLRKAQLGANKNPEAAAEAVDQLQKKLEGKILEAAKRKREALEAAHDLHSGKAGMGGASKSLKEAIKDLQSSGDLPPRLRDALDKLSKGAGKIDPRELRQLGEMLEKMLGTGLENLGKASEIMESSESLGVLKALAAGRSCSGNGGPGSIPGAGGISRGPGAAPLVLGDESDDSGVRFKPVRLDSGKGFAPAMKLGSKTTVGGIAPPEEFRAGGRSNVEIADEGGSLAGTGLGPYHSAVVESYFDKQE